MSGLQTTLCVLLLIWLLLSIYNVYLQISINLKQYKNAKELEQSIKNFDSTIGNTLKDMKRTQFFDEISELKNEDEKENEEKGDKE